MRQCKVEGCKNKYKAKDYCTKHYKQFKKRGYILTHTKYDPNDYIIEGDQCKIGCYDKNNNFVEYGIIDTWNINKCKQYKWYIAYKGSTAYLKGGSKPEIYLHSLIINSKNEIDHINNNGLDCRESNLRCATHQQNSFNKKIGKRNTSGFKGVHWHKNTKKWEACIKKDYKTIRLGYFSDKIKAALAYNAAAIEYHGEFAKLNEIPA
jgi:hypothetical protein